MTQLSLGERVCIVKTYYRKYFAESARKCTTHFRRNLSSSVKVIENSMKKFEQIGSVEVKGHRVNSRCTGSEENIATVRARVCEKSQFERFITNQYRVCISF